MAGRMGRYIDRHTTSWGEAMAAVYGRQIEQIIPADGWGAVVLSRDLAEITCEPLVTWALVRDIARTDQDQRPYASNVEGMVIDPSGRVSSVELVYGLRFLGYVVEDTFDFRLWRGAAEYARVEYQNRKALEERPEK
jgi:hypothetical protein